MPNNFNESERSQDSLVEIQTLKERLKELRNQLDLLLKSVEDLDNHSDRNTANIVRKTLSQQIQVLEMKFEETERKILSLTSKKPTSNEVTNRLKLLEFVIFGIKKQIEEKSREIEEFKNKTNTLENLVTKPGSEVLTLHHADQALLSTLEIEMQNLQTQLKQQEKLKQKLLELLSNTNSESIN